MHTAVSFVIVLGLLIFVHELGHFLFAKLFRVKVFKFSLGFGPRVVGKTIGDTEYLLSAFPLGGYVKMAGENPDDEVGPEDTAVSFSAKPIWMRFIIVAAGPFSNLLFAVLVYFLIFSLVGLPILSTRIGEVQEGSAAEAAGLLKDDLILAIDGEPTDRWEEVSDRIRESGGRPVVLTVERGGETLTVTGQPILKKTSNLFGEEVEVPLLGISASADVRIEQLDLGRAVTESLTRTVEIIQLTVLGIVKIIQHVVPASSLGGPILIAQMAGQHLEAGWVNLFYFIGLLSVNLGILNLLPIPILDGGHLVFFTMEAVMRKPLSMRTREILQQVGMVILVSLMFFVFYNDLARLFGRG
ncbi:MAG: RIP metalloprotease RseP [Thermodesulfobacteriota bacterium]